MKLPKVLGKIVYIGGYPLIYAWIKRNSRVYVVIEVNNKILFTKNWLGCHRDWRLPGGGVKTGETNLAALVRETYEETGLQLDISQIKQITNDFQLSKHGFKYLIYYIKLNRQPKITMAAEIAEAQFIPKNQCLKLHLSEIAGLAGSCLKWS
jgi:8-oxo-dGTP diphosphatase